MGRLRTTVLVGAVVLGVFAPAAHAAVDFDEPVGYAASAPVDVTSGDFNADGVIDLATVGATSTSATVLLGVGDGSFRPPDSFTVEAPATGIASGRLNADGFDDLAISHGAPTGELVRYLSNGADGTFGGAADTATGLNTEPRDVALGRLDGNSTVDAAVANFSSDQVTIHPGDGGGGFSAFTTLAVTDPLQLAIGDLDADGDNDLAIAASGDVFAAENNAGAFTLSPGLVGSGAVAVAVADVDRDGRGDVVAVKDDGALAVVRSSASEPSGFEAALPQSAGGNANSVAAADFDADGVPDLVVSNSDSEMTALIGRGDGTFSPTDGFPAAGNPSDVQTGDFDRDGNPDAAVTTTAPDRVLVFRSRRPQLSFTPPNIDFGDQRPGTTSGVRTFRLTNNGPPRARIADVAAQGTTEFSIVSNNCDGANLGLGQSCEVGVRFAPTADGRREGRLGIATHNAGGPHFVGLIGAGVTPGPLPGDCANDLSGTAGAETLDGTDAGDSIFGFGGNDILNGLAGNDCLIGGPGNDRLNGGAGSDELEGSSGRDVALGGSGRDRLVGGSSRDRLSGGSSGDALNGGSSHDRLSGGTGNDRLSGSSGNDRLTGSRGNDRLSGGRGRNTYSGGSGRDSINSRNRRSERVNCGSGRDTVRADRSDRLRRCERVRRR